MIAYEATAFQISAPDTASPPSVDGERFRRTMCHLAGGVCVVTTVDRWGGKLGLTVTAVASVSLEPPLLLVCVDNRSRTIAPLQAGQPFVVHVLAADQEALARRFASFVPDKFAGIAHRSTPSGCPRLDGVLASLECAVHRLVPAGDHRVVIGRVIDARVSGEGGRPLLYLDGRYVAT